MVQFDAGWAQPEAMPLVYLAAAGALHGLGLNVVGKEATGQPTAAPRRWVRTALRDRQAWAKTRWVTAVAALKERGYSVRWNAAARQLDGVRGSRRIRLHVGDYTALVNGRRVRMDLPPHALDGKVRIATTFTRTLAAR